ncbi:transmembrane protein [Ectopseudomonas mendocina]|nr:transmembrane protein [Pseudomonas mendocina]
MSESHVTQCPHCRTSFRVSQAQLAAAHGAVRCGACLHVFNAAEQLFGKAAASAPPGAAKPAPAPATKIQPEPPRKPAPSKPADDTLWIHDDLDLDSLDLDEELAKLEEQEQQLSQQFLALERAPRYSETFSSAPPPEEDEPHDEAWAEALLRDEPVKRSGFELQAEDQQASPEVAAPIRPVDEPPAAVTPPRQQPAIKELDEPDEPRLGDLDQHQDDQDPPAPQVGAKREEPRSMRSEPGLRDERLFELDDEPLQLEWQPHQGIAWGRVLGWGLLNLLAAAGLLAQYVAYNFDELARQDRYRPWFEQLCPNIGCSLPSKVDISQIRSSNLVVRSHPEFSGALIVDAILYNRAPFAQPFPLLEMRFADLGGQLVASRRFKPSEYLAGELAGQSEMPPQTPIHISLDILDPGTRAVNYSLSFHSPE